MIVRAKMVIMDAEKCELACVEKKFMKTSFKSQFLVQILDQELIFV